MIQSRRMFNWDLPQISENTGSEPDFIRLGRETLRLLTNNPDKVSRLQDFGLEIKERVYH